MSRQETVEFDLARVPSQVERLLAVGRAEEARKLLGKALRQQPDDVELLALGARAAHAAGAAAESRSLVAEVLQRAPDNWSARVIHYLHLVDDRNFVEAEQQVLELLREDPANTTLIVQYAQLMLETVQIDKARALVGEALRIDPDDDDAQRLDAILCVIHGEGEPAMQRLAQLAASDPESVHVIATAVSVLSSRHQYRAALDLAQSLVRSAPHDSDYVDIVIELRAATHPLSWVLWPLQRFGWYGSAAMWALGIIALQAASRWAPQLTFPLAAVIIGWVAYSWIAPPLLKRWLARRGVR